MRFLLTEEQRDFGRSVAARLAAAEVPAVARAWAAGDPGPGRAVWRGLAETGLFALAAPEEGAAGDAGGLGSLAVVAAVGFVEVGRAGAPGPLVETAATAALLSALGEDRTTKRFLPGLLSGDTTATLRLPGSGPYAVDADRVDHVFTVTPAGELRVLAGGPDTPTVPSLDPSRRLGLPAGDTAGELLASGERVLAAARAAESWARLLTAAQVLGVGGALLTRTVQYAGQRAQFGVPIGSFQAVKHRLADTLLGLEFARPLLWAAAATLEGPGPEGAAVGPVAAAKLAAGEAAYAAAGTALRVHGAVGYTEELDLSLWLRRARPLRDAWGTPARCRELVVTHGAG
ncbi:acyl-CoA dehydrogenase family protein [Streptomyces sp. BI20]|uniref:acyl-CoA dehydrogenase family protein n=1 Tax=Streptomyces sp. BI20 TaxID=3403460 RepID=UPI003C73ED23